MIYIEIIILVVEILLLIALVSWREVQILIDIIGKGKWQYKHFKKLFWHFDQSNKEKILWIIPKKNLDSFHVSNGLATLIICHLIAENYPLFQFVEGSWNTVILIPLYWITWMQIRNLFMKLCRK